MTTPRISASRSARMISRLPPSRLIRRLKIGGKLTVGFGLMVVMTLVVVGLTYYASTAATEKIDSIGEVRVPTMLVAEQAQTHLLQMLSDVRGYLALGDEQFRKSYAQSSQAFAANVADLERLWPNITAANRARLDELNTTFQTWSALPERLFDLRDDQLEREPAYRLLVTDGSLSGGRVLIDINRLIESQAKREPSEVNSELLGDMANFQGTFAGMFSALRGYVTTRNRIFRQEYEANLAANTFAWDELNAKRTRLNPTQQSILDEIAANRQTFLDLIPNQVFKVLEGEHWREDLYLFRVEGLTLANRMQELLSAITTSQQEQLQSELSIGRNELDRANLNNLVSGVVAIFLAVGLAIIFRENIAGPIRRLTQVAEQIRAGDLGILSQVESSDEIGRLAATFNKMTVQLRQTLLQARAEKRRADDLLEVVIPIGVALSSEKDFDRLLENILLEAKSFCRADAGILYLRTDDNQLKHVIVRGDMGNIALGGTSGERISFPPLALYDPVSAEPNHRNVAAYVALSGSPVNIPNAYQATDFDIKGPTDIDKLGDDHSQLTIPLKNNAGQVVGVLQLIDAQDPQTGRTMPFDTNLQQMMESYSSLAVAALEAYIREQSLRREIRQLRIEIDQVKRRQQVDAIVETDFFQSLQTKVRAMRNRASTGDQDIGGEQAEAPAELPEDLVAGDATPSGNPPT